MMRAIFEQLLLVPTVLVWIAVFGLLVWRWRRLSLACLIAAIGGLFVLSLPIVARALLLPLLATVTLYDGADLAGDIILVPTAGIFRDVEGTPWPSAESIRRASQGRRIQVQTGLPLAIIGGDPQGIGVAEAFVVADALGETPGPVVIDGAADNSIETAFALARIVREIGGREVILATTPTHVARMAASLRRVGVVVLADLSAHPARQPVAITDFLPSAGGLAQSRHVIREYAAILWYLFDGSIRVGDLRPAAG